MKMTTEQRVTRGRAVLMRNFPFFGSLVMQLQMEPATHLPTAATDGEKIFYNPEWVEGLTTDELLFVLAHEAAHCAHLHQLRRQDRDNDLWNIACDYAINGLLTERGLKMPEEGLLDERFGHDSAEKIYAQLQDKAQQQPAEQDGDAGGGGNQEQQQEQEGKGQSDGGDGNTPQQAEGEQSPDSGDGNAQPQQPTGDGNTQQQGSAGAGQPQAPVNDPGKCGAVMDAPHDAAHMDEQIAQQQERKWTRAVADAAQIEAKVGSMGGYLEEWVKDFLEPKRDWRDELRDCLTRVTKDDYSWRQPARRFISHGLYLPSQHSESAGHVVIAVDTSGSISSKWLQQFGGEIDHILEDVAPTLVTVLYCDTRINEVQQYERDEFNEWTHSCKGRGGTRTKPVFDWIAEHEDDEPVEALVYLTDLVTHDLPKDDADFPVIWACTTNRVAPSGRTIHLKD